MATTAPPAITGTVTVYAAASLTRAFTDLATLFERRYPGTHVQLNFAGSPTLVTQIFQGAPADAFASADTANMDRLVDSGLIRGKPTVFIHNQLHIVVGKGNPKGISTLADLARGDVATVLCAPAVPCGNYSRQILTRAGVTVTPRSNETSVTAVIGRVANGEADAGIVYVTDVLADSRVSGVVIPDDQNLIADYPLAVLQDAPHAVAGAAFSQFVLSRAAAPTFAKYGFRAL